jgi:hypothetical protein
MISLTKQFLTLSLCVILSACGGGNTVESNVTTADRLTVSGCVGDGPIVGATVILKSLDGDVLATTTSDQHAQYTLSATVDSNAYPLILEASSGTDLVTAGVPDFTLVSVLAEPSVSHVNINPHSTFIAKTANAMPGGIEQTNLEQARRIVISELNFGLDTDLIDDPVATKIDIGNLPTITYASEALAELIRRTRTALNGQTDTQEILNALAADLVDGVLNGRGAAAVNASLTRVAQSAGLQILLESMLQDLKVNGVSAERQLSGAITTVLGTSNRPSLSYRSNMVKWPMLKQARAVIRALRQNDTSVTLRDLMQVMLDLGERATTQEIVAALARYGMDQSISETIETSNEQDSVDTTHPTSSNENPVVTQADPTEATTNDTAVAEPEENTPTPSGGTLMISGSPSSDVAEGENYRFTPTVTASPGASLSFDVTNLPTWAGFDAANGTLSGLPGFNAAGNYENILISVSDGTATASLTPFSIQVVNTNLSPTILGNPAIEVTAGQRYLFSPQAADPDGDVLTFSINNLPAWASFDQNTGELNGTPAETDVGLYENIEISVSDGSLSAALTNLHIEVLPAPVTTGSARLSWEIPSSRTDGSPLSLSEIAGYRLYMGQSSDALNMILDLNDSSIKSHTVKELSTGTYYFSVTTYDTEGNESTFSNIAVKTIM